MAGIAITRRQLTAADLRASAGRTKDLRAVRRTLAIALVLADDLTPHTSELFDAAIRSPVAITKHRKPKFVLMSMDQYQQLARDATQQVHMPDEMPVDLKAAMIEGLEPDLHQDCE